MSDAIWNHIRQAERRVMEDEAGVQSAQAHALIAIAKALQDDLPAGGLIGWTIIQGGLISSGVFDSLTEAKAQAVQWPNAEVVEVWRP